jgi:precorrin-6A/cobalt-precorrin-6A reductase
MARLSGVRNRILILGGTSDARDIARHLKLKGYDVITSLAGATTAPLLPEGQVRSGGFGGKSGLEDFLRKEGIALVVDATHPFAAEISRNGSAAAESCGIEFLRLERPGWTPGAGDRWIFVKTIAEAVQRTPRNARIFLTIGQKQIGGFLARDDLSGVVRCIEQPKERLSPRWTLVLARPPFSVEGEISLMREHEIGILVSKNSGGAQTAAKLAAARQLQIPVIMVERPSKPAAKTASSVDGMMELIAKSL